jgi:Ice-binding-like
MKTKYLSIVPAALFMGIPMAQASVLLSAENFAILGGTAITSTGTLGTVISNGDVGLSPEATTGITGFPPAIIQNGAIIPTGGVTGQARLDLITVTTGLALMPTDTTLSNLDLGGMTLTSGVYTFGGAATLNGALVLDGQGMDNAYWVFQISTSLTTSAGSTVTVINPGPSGASDYGIFWDAGAEIIVGATNAILGNYLSGTSITMGSTSSGSGRALALAAVTLDQNAIDAYGGPLSSDWTGGLMYDVDGVNIIPVPEPSSALLSSVALLGFLTSRNRRSIK